MGEGKAFIGTSGWNYSHWGKGIFYPTGLKPSLLLFQLPPFFKVNYQHLGHLLDLLTHQVILSEVRIAFEFRNKTWRGEEIFRLLMQKNAALCFADWPDLTVTEPPTADFIYLRRHGSTLLYSSCYSEEELSIDADHIQKWLSEGKDVFVYFNNDAQGRAIKNALRLLEMVH